MSAKNKAKRKQMCETIKEIVAIANEICRRHKIPEFDAGRLPEFDIGHITFTYEWVSHLHNLFIKPYMEVRNLLPEHVWDAYEALGATDLVEVLRLKEHEKAFREYLKTRPLSIKASKRAKRDGKVLRRSHTPTDEDGE